MFRLVAAVICSAGLVAAAPSFAQQTTDLDTFEKRFSYYLGLKLHRNFESPVMDTYQFDFEAFRMGVEDALDRSVLRVPLEELSSEAGRVEHNWRITGESRAKPLVAGQAFLKRNAARPGIVTLRSGVQYRVDRDGAGLPPSEAQRVTVHYSGRLLDGKVFDSSRQRDRPATFGVNEVIPGWTEILQLMQPGARWEVWIPSELAYGARGAGDQIGPDQVLNFEIQLISIDG